jgi:hypothetical protein
MHTHTHTHTHTRINTHKYILAPDQVSIMRIIFYGEHECAHRTLSEMNLLSSRSSEKSEPSAHLQHKGMEDAENVTSD